MQQCAGATGRILAIWQLGLHPYHAALAGFAGDGAREHFSRKRGDGQVPECRLVSVLTVFPHLWSFLRPRRGCKKIVSSRQQLNECRKRITRVLAVNMIGHGLPVAEASISSAPRSIERYSTNAALERLDREPRYTKNSEAFID